MFFSVAVALMYQFMFKLTNRIRVPLIPRLARMQFVSAERPPLVVRRPVPSDIEVSQSVVPEHADRIAANAGILPDEVELYGRYKAKVY